jgi:sulfatase maturation enzyme AslB (radical SAM superfamily)
METHKKPLCAWPYFHQKVNSNGTVMPCCAWHKNQKNGITDDNPTDRDGFFHGQFMQKVRDAFAQGIMPANCDSCTYAESLYENSWSYRKLGLQFADEMGIDFNDPQLLSQEIDLGNLCNIKCRTCDQYRSTKWVADSEALGMKPVGLLSADWSLTDAQALSIKHLTFLGGEPMMYQDKICSELSKLGERLSELRLNLTSNMTIPLCRDLVDLLRRTKSTWFICSIDGYEGLNDYIRSDSQWHDVQNNVRQMQDLHAQHSNIGFGTNFTFSVFNAHNFVRFNQWWQTINTNIGVTLVTYPIFHDARNLPQDYKHALLDHYISDAGRDTPYQRAVSQIVEHLRQQGSIQPDEWRQSLKKHNDMLDSRRGTSLAEANPRLAAILG